MAGDDLPHSVDRLFTQVMASFAVKELFSFLSFHLSIVFNADVTMVLLRKAFPMPLSSFWAVLFVACLWSLTCCCELPSWYISARTHRLICFADTFVSSQKYFPSSSAFCFFSCPLSYRSVLLNFHSSVYFPFFFLVCFFLISFTET